MKYIPVFLLLFVVCVSMASCDILSPEKEENSYKSALEQLEAEGKVSKSRRIDLVREVIKANEDYTEVDIDKEKIGLE